VRDLRINAYCDPASRTIGLYIRDNGALLAEISGKVVTEPGCWTPPSLSLTEDQAQYLMDQLWNCGLRPTEGEGSPGALAALERHLEDMRAIAFHKLGVRPSCLRD